MNCLKCGACCKLFLVSLNEKEYKSRKYKLMFNEYIDDFNEAELRGFNILAQKEDNSCIYLDGNKCLINDWKPECCRRFFCDSKDAKLQDAVEKVKEFKRKLNL